MPITIKGKSYVTVNERLKEFREKYPDHSLESEFIELTNDRVVMRATIKDKTGRVISQGVAWEDKDNKYSMVNKTSYIENCETSAWGRALANFGIGIDASVASADEVVVAMTNNDLDWDKEQAQKSYQECVDILGAMPLDMDADLFNKTIGSFRETSKKKQWTQGSIETFKRKVEDAAKHLGFVKDGPVYKEVS